jgi:MFS family permease
MITDIIGIVGLGLSIIANLYTLYLARFIIGLAVGLNSTLVPLYIKEYTPLKLTGTMGSMNQFTINFGILVAFFFGLGYSGQEDSNYWRIVFLVPVITSFLRIVVLLTIFKDDPPGYYVKKG